MASRAERAASPAAARAPVSPAAGGGGTSMPARRISRPSSRMKLRASMTARTFAVPAGSPRQLVEAEGRSCAAALAIDPAVASTPNRIRPQSRATATPATPSSQRTSRPRDLAEKVPAPKVNERSEWGGTAAPSAAARFLTVPGSDIQGVQGGYAPDSPENPGDRR